jgi:hypothetical protein
MNAPAHINQFDWRTVRCGECDHGKVYEHDSIGIRAVTCSECDGRKVIDASCDGCDKLVPLDADNLCKQCVESLPVELTTCAGDPLLRANALRAPRSRPSDQAASRLAAPRFDRLSRGAGRG